jgi:long-chain acyl-CoA synthetase
MPVDIFGTPGSVEVGEKKQGEGRARRLAICKDALVTQPWEGIDTTCDVLTYAAKTYGTRDAVGWRDVVEEIEEEKEVTKNVGGKEIKEKKKWKYFKLGPFQYYNFVQVQEIVSEVARGLAEIGIGKDDVFNVYASTRYASLSDPFSSSESLQ